MLFHCKMRKSNRGLQIFPHYNVSNIKTGGDTVKGRGLSSLMSTLANVSHKGQHTGTQRVLLRQNKATRRPTIGTSPSVILTSPSLKIPLCSSSSPPLPHGCKVFHLLPELMPVILQRRKSTGPFKNLIWAPSPLPLNPYPADGGLAPAGNTSTLSICCKSLGFGGGGRGAGGLLTRRFHMTNDAFLFL